MQYENMIGLIGTLKQIEKIDEVNGFWVLLLSLQTPGK